MKYYLKIYFLLVIFIIIGCKSNQEEKPIDIRGNWYSYNFPSEPIDGFDEYLQFNYEEVFINSNIIFNCILNVGFVSPSGYKLKGDSLFVSFGIYDRKDALTYKGKIIQKTPDSFIIYNNNDSLFYYSLKNISETLDRYIIDDKTEVKKYKDSINIFNRAFFKRSQECYL